MIRTGTPATGTTGDGSRSPARFRVGVLLACLVYAGVALGSGLDRLTAHKADPATEVPALFANKALESRAWAAMGHDDWAGTARIAPDLVSHEPVEPVAVAILGAARDGIGDAKGAEAAFRVAAQMGWRVDLTQRYWIDRSLAAHDYQAAAAHVDALLRQDPSLLTDRDLLDPMERNDAGQQALAMRLVARPDWFGPYLADVSNVPKDILLLRAQVLERAARLGVSGGCKPAAFTAYRLVGFGEAALAARIWRENCPQPGQGLVFDGNFAAATFTSTLTPFDWEFDSNSDVDTAFVPDTRVGPHGGKWLTISTSAPATRVVARQFLVVPAGSYRLSWASQGHTGADTPMVVASLHCEGADNNWLPATFDSHSQRWMTDVTLGDTCVGKWLQFAVRPGVEAGAGVRGGDVTLGEVRLEPLPAS